jgi:hypothetical protein
MKSKGKPRNPFVALAKFRKAGSHAKPVKSLRRQEKQALAKAYFKREHFCHDFGEFDYRRTVLLNGQCVTQCSRLSFVPTL